MMAVASQGGEEIESNEQFTRIWNNGKVVEFRLNKPLVCVGDVGIDTKFSARTDHYKIHIEHVPDMQPSLNTLLTAMEEKEPYPGFGVRLHSSTWGLYSGSWEFNKSFHKDFTVQVAGYTAKILTDTNESLVVSNIGDLNFILACAWASDGASTFRHYRGVINNFYIKKI